jgi:hypothetical protein
MKVARLRLNRKSGRGQLARLIDFRHHGAIRTFMMTHVLSHAFSVPTHLEERNCVEPCGIQDDGDHQFVALNRDACPLGNSFIRSKPNRTVFGTTITTRLIQGYNVMPGSLFLDLKHP